MKSHKRIENYVKESLLNSKNLNEFNKLCVKNNLNFFNDLDEEICKHYKTLCTGGSVYNHTDQREAFK